MKRLTIVAPEQLVLEEVEIDSELPKEHALVQVEVISLCGSDYKLYFGQYSGPATYPIVFGHEWSGTVLKVNSGSDKIEVGDKVTGDCSKWCGECPTCAVDKNLCAKIEKFGITTNGFSQQLAVVPLRYLYKAPSSLDVRVLAMAEFFAVALHAIKKLPEHEKLAHGKQNILIIGGGPIGLALYFLLSRHYQQERVTLYETSTLRREMIRRLLNVEVSAPEYRDTAPNSYRELVAAAHYDIVFEAVGKFETLQQAVYLTLPGGRVVCVGMLGSETINLAPVILKGLRLFGSVGGTGEFEEVIGFLQEHQTWVKNIVTRVFSLEESAQAFDHETARNNLKVQIKF